MAIYETRRGVLLVVEGPCTDLIITESADAFMRPQVEIVHQREVGAPVDGEVHHIGVVVEDVLRPIAVVDVPVQDEHPLDGRVLQGCLSTSARRCSGRSRDASTRADFGPVTHRLSSPTSTPRTMALHHNGWGAGPA